MATYDGRRVPKSAVDAYLQGREASVREAYDLIVFTLQLIAEGLYPPEEYINQIDSLPLDIQKELEREVFDADISLLGAAKSQFTDKTSRTKAA